ncbi:hypothetical protein ACLI50_13110 [Chryseobacterium sp. EZn1]
MVGPVNFQASGSIFVIRQSDVSYLICVVVNVGFSKKNKADSQ